MFFFFFCGGGRCLFFLHYWLNFDIHLFHTNFSVLIAPKSSLTVSRFDDYRSPKILVIIGSRIIEPSFP